MEYATVSLSVPKIGVQLGSTLYEPFGKTLSWLTYDNSVALKNFPFLTSNRKSKRPIVK
jgi:hypothetical protein